MFEKFARRYSGRHKQATFSDAGFLGVLRVNSVLNMVPLLQFFVRAYVTFVLSILFLICPSFGASGRLCFVIVAFPGHLYLHIVAF